MKSLFYKFYVTIIILINVLCICACSRGQNNTDMNYNTTPCSYSFYPFNDSSSANKYFLEIIKNIINQQVFQTDSVANYIFDIEGERPWRFFVYDLTDNTFILQDDSKMPEFGHLYHFAAFKTRYSFSNICIVTSKGYAIFEKINCLDSYCNPQILLDFLKNENIKFSNSLKKRVLNYRKYGKFIKNCGYDGLMCN